MNDAAQTAQENLEAASSAAPFGDVALIEEQIDTGLDELLTSYQPARDLNDLPIDEIPDRYSISVNEPLPQFDSGMAKAYAATDLQKPERPIYALVCEPYIPNRMQAIEGLEQVSHPNLCTLHAHETIKLSHINEARLTLFLDLPQGERLSDVIARGAASFNERRLMDTIIAPIISALQACREKNISHGCINPDNIFIGETLTLGECVSEPAGFSQQLIYEPIERALAAPIGKGAATEKTDAYAIAILTYKLLYGTDRYERVSPKDYVAHLLEAGVYHIYSANVEFSETMTDFFRGTLLENKGERWGISQIAHWLDGKRYNLIHPSLPSEASRPFTFAEEEYYSRKTLAHGIHMHWQQAAKTMRGAHIDRWMEMSLHKADEAEIIERIIRNSASHEKGKNEMNARMIIALDPLGPIRMKEVSFNVDGIGPMIADSLRNNQHKALNYIVEIIDADLANFWSEMSDIEKTQTTSNIIWKLQRLRMHVKQRSIGFGMERLLYDLNPTLPCQSDLLKSYCITDLKTALRTMDALAGTYGSNTSLLDRHFSAFLASKSEMGKQVTFSNLSKLPKLRDNQELHAMRIIALAQDKTDKEKLFGLSAWCAKRLEGMIEHIQNRTLRKKLKKNLKPAAQTGHIGRVLAVLIENEHTQSDSDGFSKALHAYAYSGQKITLFENATALRAASRDLGGRIAVFIAYLILGITCYILLDQYYL